MNANVFQQQVKSALYKIAPDLENETLDESVRYHDQFDFDSMDFLRFVIELHRITGLDIPETDYPRLATLGNAVVYLQERAAGVAGAEGRGN